MNETAKDSLLVEALLTEGAYAHPVNEIRLVETHLSWVFLTGDYVYKVKKPLRYPFVDFSTLALRKHFCEEELRLNRRFNTEIYLDVVPIIKHGDNGFRVVDNADETTVVDWAVRMRQFNTAAQADVLLANHELDVEELTRFGEHLAQQHAALPISDAPYDPVGPIKDNFDSLKRSGVTANFSEKLSAIEAHAAKTIAELQQALETRHERGFVRECHGDLHLSNIVRLKDGLRAFDCLEFNPQLSTIDIANDLAFLFMDCMVRKRADLAYAFLDGYLDTSGDYAGAELLTVFAAYRSMVRAKVAALRLEQVPAESSTLDKLTTHISWAYDLSRWGIGNILLMHGFSGSGKSYWAKQLVPRLGAIRIRSDVLRKNRAGVASRERLGLGVGEAMYSATSSQAVYAAMTAHADRLVRNGETVIIDATSLRFEQRKVFYDLAETLHAKCRVVALTASQEVLLRRIRQRTARDDDPSDADAAVLTWQQAHADPFEIFEPVIRFNTEDASLEMLLEALAMPS